MSDTILDLTGGRVPFPEVQAALGYKDPRPAQQLLDQLEVPFVKIRRVRHYRPDDVRDALDRMGSRGRAA